MNDVVTRFPPSPTGFLHIGGARTALFNWLLARSRGGRFILRIEDTDQARFTPEMTQAILDGMTWLGLDWDDGPYFQSERNDIYNERIDALLKADKAYFCDCTPQQVEAMREKARAEGRKPKYDGTCREKCLEAGPDRVVRFKTPLGETVTFADMVKGPVAVSTEELDDLVLRRPDGSPTYHMAVVVDDHLMGVNHVLRGDDHLSNTPRQILLFQALGFELPRFGHVPMILGQDKKKLSKRHGALSVMEYEKDGFLPEAVVNYLARLGWSHGDQELFTKEELLQFFDTDHLNSSPSAFDLEKLKWVNAEYIKSIEIDRLAELLAVYLSRTGFEDVDSDHLKKVAPHFRERAQTMVELAETVAFLFVPAQELEYDAKAAQKAFTDEGKTHLAGLKERFAAVEDFAAGPLHDALEGYIKDYDLKFKAVGMPLRVALVGKGAGPGVDVIMELLGKEEALARLERAAS